MQMQLALFSTIFKKFPKIVGSAKLQKLQNFPKYAEYVEIVEIAKLAKNAENSKKNVELVTMWQSIGLTSKLFLLICECPRPRGRDPKRVASSNELARSPIRVATFT